ncbi:MAG: VWA domain-containing protein [candidate division KSB1 bacterium]|nr:VWA domain-containing protein [candidate division KSB1 bacterium]MDZ7340773.1 VWA domain-containing protein [candidate division KSB1 bacterium]
MMLLALIRIWFVPFAFGQSNAMAVAQTTMLDSLNLLYNDINASQFPRIVSLVTVTNEIGFVVGKLDENNFKVYEDNVRELPILVEELPVADFGISVVLAIDRSGSMRGQPVADAKNAASIFVTLMQPQDQSAVVSFNHEPHTDYPFTNQVDSLKAAIATIEANGGTAVYDALMHSTYLFTSYLKNRAIILLTDGADKDSRYTYQEALTALISHEIRVFSIGLGLNRNSPEENILKDVANKTGGLYFYSPSSKELEEIYKAISKLLHHRYRVTYTTHNPAKDGTLRHVQIQVSVNSNSSADTASYRAPYEAPPVDTTKPKPPVVPPPPEPVFEAVPNPFTPNDDGFNDWTEFRQGDSIPLEWVITILDRAGRPVRTLKNGDRFWNGKDESGQAMLPGCYLYLVANGGRIIHRGLIQLIR